MTATATLVLRLAAPLQSWGISSRFSERDTAREPSKSGVIGLLCAALGRPRHEPLDDLAALRMAVRVEREGRLLRDFQTAGGGSVPQNFAVMHGRKKRDYGVSRASGAPGDTDISNRYYLADAEFLVAVGGSRAVLEQIERALNSPVWPLFLGRKAFVPSLPIVRTGSLFDDAPADTLRIHPWRRRLGDSERSFPSRLRLVLETQEEKGSPRHDVPLTFAKGRRAFMPRFVTIDWAERPADFTIDDSEIES